MSDITLIVEFAVKDGQAEAYRAASAALREKVDATEPGTSRYDWWLDADGRRAFNLEVFDDGAALAFHMDNTAPLVGALLDAADLVRVEVLGEVDATGRAAIDEAATGYFAALGGISR
jgi:quinol monooxygenase YgiN